MSAKNSADALAAKYNEVLHKYVFSWKTNFDMYTNKVWLMIYIYKYTIIDV